MFDDWCGPENCGFAGLLYDYQTLVTGLLAAVAAIATVVVLRVQIRQASRDAASAIKANRENFERQIAHEKESREAQRQEDLQREMENISTALFNESEELAGALTYIAAAVEGVTEAERQVSSEELLPFIGALHEPVDRLSKQIALSDAAIKPLPLSMTRVARAAMAEISAHCVMMSVEIDRAIRKQKPGPYALMQFRNHIEGVKRGVASLRRPAELGES